MNDAAAGAATGHERAAVGRLDIDTSGNALKRAVSDAVLTSSTGPGPSLIIAAGIAILVGAQVPAGDLPEDGIGLPAGTT